MIVKSIFVVILAACIVAVKSQTEDPPVRTFVSTTLKQLVKSDIICEICQCTEGKVHCRKKGLTEFFTGVYWAGLVDKDVKEMDLSGNSLVNIDRFPELPIQFLNLSRCSIETIAISAFSHLQQMQTLDLSWNRLRSQNLNPRVFQGRYSPEFYEPLQAMRTLDLSHNDLHSLHQDLFEHLPKLTELDLSFNEFDIIDLVSVIALSSLPDLKVLKMRGCRLHELPERFLHVNRYLEHLDISGNEFREVPQELVEARSLLSLNLDQNPIERIGKEHNELQAFPELPELEELHLSRLPELRFIGPCALGGLQKLKTVHLTDNSKLHYIAPNAFAKRQQLGESYVWPQLKELYISGNHLGKLDPALVPRWDKLSALEAQSNPYQCDCTTQWMVDTLVPIVDRLRSNASNEMVCSHPMEMAGRTLQELHEQHRILRCPWKNMPRSYGA